MHVVSHPIMTQKGFDTLVDEKYQTLVNEIKDKKKAFDAGFYPVAEKCQQAFNTEIEKDYQLFLSQAGENSQKSSLSLKNHLLQRAEAIEKSNKIKLILAISIVALTMLTLISLGILCSSAVGLLSFNTAFILMATTDAVAIVSLLSLLSCKDKSAEHLREITDSMK